MFDHSQYVIFKFHSTSFTTTIQYPSVLKRKRIKQNILLFLFIPNYLFIFTEKEDMISHNYRHLLNNLLISREIWEKVRTTNFTTSKTKKNIEKFGDNHYIEKIY